MMADRTLGNGGGTVPVVVRERVSGLHHRLEALARAPVPPPDPRFADELLVRLVTNRPALARGAGAEVVTAGAGAVGAIGVGVEVEVGGAGRNHRRRKPSAGRLAFAAVAAAAAVWVLLPPTLDIVEQDGTRAELATASLAPQLGVRNEVRVGPGGALLDRAGRPLVVPDGAATLTCSAAMTFEAAGGAYRCEAGESVAVRVEGAAVVWSSAMPTETGLADLRLVEPGIGLPLRWSWSPFDGPKISQFAAYELVRGRSNEPALADGTATEVVARIEDIRRTSFEELEAPDHDATYQVRGLDRDGRLLALSNAVQVSVDSGG